MSNIIEYRRYIEPFFNKLSNPNDTVSYINRNYPNLFKILKIIRSGKDLYHYSFCQKGYWTNRDVNISCSILPKQCEFDIMVVNTIEIPVLKRKYYHGYQSVGPSTLFLDEKECYSHMIERIEKERNLVLNRIKEISELKEESYNSYINIVKSQMSKLE